MLAVPTVLGHLKEFKKILFSAFLPLYRSLSAYTYLELLRLEMPDDEADSLISARSALVYFGTKGLSRRNILYWLKSVEVFTPYTTPVTRVTYSPFLKDG